MHTIIGRLTCDAKVKKLNDGREVVNFTVAQNDRFKAKGSDQVKKFTNYFNCTYWMGTGIAAHMKKGILIEISGRIGVNAWQNASGEPKANLTLHVQQIYLHGKATNSPGEAAAPTIATKSNEDLPF